MPGRICRAGRILPGRSEPRHAAIMAKLAGAAPWHGGCNLCRSWRSSLPSPWCPAAPASPEITAAGGDDPFLALLAGLILPPIQPAVTLASQARARRCSRQSPRQPDPAGSRCPATGAPCAHRTHGRWARRRECRPHPMCRRDSIPSPSIASPAGGAGSDHRPATGGAAGRRSRHGSAPEPCAGRQARARHGRDRRRPDMDLRSRQSAPCTAEGGGPAGRRRRSHRG